MLRDRNIALVVAARFLSRAGGTAAFFIGIWGTAAYEFDATAQQLAFLSAGEAIAGIVGTIIAGVLIDRLGPRKVMFSAELLSIPAVIGIAFADSFLPFVFAAMLFSLFAVPPYTAGASFAPFLVEGTERLERANSLIEAAGSTGFIMGPALGAVISQTFGLPYVFVLMGVFSIGAAACAFAVRIDETPGHPNQRHPLLELRDGLRVSYRTRSLRYFILLGTLAWFGFGAFSALEPLFYRDVVGVGIEWIGYMNTLFGVGLVTGAWLLPKLPKKIVCARGAATVVAVMGLGAIGYVGTRQLPIIALGALSWGVVIGIAEPLLRTLIHVDSPHEFVGRVTSTAQYHRSAGELIPLAIAPGLAAILGVQPVLIGGGIIVAILALGSLVTARSIDAQRTERREPVAQVAQIEAAQS